MNERIKELKQQATFYANKEFAATGSHELWTDLFSEKFAELIIRECAQVVDEKIDFGRFAYGPDDWAEGADLLKHFGVK